MWSPPEILLSCFAVSSPASSLAWPPSGCWEAGVRVDAGSRTAPFQHGHRQRKWLDIPDGRQNQKNSWEGLCVYSSVWKCTRLPLHLLFSPPPHFLSSSPLRPCLRLRPQIPNNQNNSPQIWTRGMHGQSLLYSPFFQFLFWSFLLIPSLSEAKKPTLHMVMIIPAFPIFALLPSFPSSFPYFPWAELGSVEGCCLLANLESHLSLLSRNLLNNQGNDGHKNTHIPQQSDHIYSVISVISLFFECSPKLVKWCAKFPSYGEYLHLLQIFHCFSTLFNFWWLLMYLHRIYSII